MNLTFGNYLELCAGLNKLGSFYNKKTPNKIVFDDESVLTLQEIGETIRKNNANLVNSKSGKIYLSKVKRARFLFKKKKTSDNTLSKNGQDIAERINRECNPNIFHLS